MGIFSLTVIVIIFAIVRVAVVTSENTQADISWLYMWGNIEMTVGTSLYNQLSPLNIQLADQAFHIFTAVVVACLASFRQLFVKSGQTGFIQQAESSTSWHKRLLSSHFRSTSKLMGSSGRKTSSTSPGINGQSSAHSLNKSTDHIVPLDSIYVDRKVDVHTVAVGAREQMAQADVSNTCYPAMPGRTNVEQDCGERVGKLLRGAVHKSAV